MTLKPSQRPAALLAVPALSVAAYVTARALASTPEAEAQVGRATAVAASALPALGAFLTARRFRPGDYLRRAWALQAISMGATTVAALLRWPGAPAWLTLARTGLVSAVNVVGVLATIFFARTFAVAGLALPGSAARRRSLVVGATALALLVTALPLYAQLTGPAPAGGPVTPVEYAISGLGDAIALALIAPISLTALALRGGLLGWPWGFLAASSFCWLLCDAQGALVVAARLSAEGNATARAFGEPLRVLGCTLLFCAAMAQRWLIGAPAGGEPAPGNEGEGDA